MHKKFSKIFLLLSLYFTINGQCTDDSVNMMAKKLAQEQLSKGYLSGGIWDKNYLLNHPEISNKLTKYEDGKLCKSLKDLDTANLTHLELSIKLKGLGYLCYRKPLAVNPKDPTLRYLKKDGSNTSNQNEVGVVWQEVCVEPNDGCVVRIKMDGFPKSRRPAPHSTKSILLNSDQDASSYDNEACKITSRGTPVPKGPDVKFGLSSCPYKSDKACEVWIDEIMAAAHPTLKNTP